MLILPVKMAEMKEKDSVFFIFLLNIYLKTSTLHFAICDEDILFNSITYRKFPVKIGAKKETVDNKRDNVELELSDVTSDFEIAVMSGADFRSRKIEIIQIAYPDSLSDPTQFRYYFVGEMDSPYFDNDKSQFKVTVKSPISNYTTGRTLMLSCNNIFADGVYCLANKDLLSGTIQTGSDQNTIIIEQSKTDNYWINGLITINGETQRIKSSTSTTIQTEYPFLFTVSGDYTIQRHCDKSFAVCKNTFSQGVNYSGCPAIPFEQVIKT